MREEKHDVVELLAMGTMIHLDISGAMAALLMGNNDGVADAFANAIIRVTKICEELGIDLHPIIESKGQPQSLDEITSVKNE